MRVHRLWRSAAQDWDLYLNSGKDETSIAAQALRRIADLYAIERDIRGQPPDVRQAQRQERAGPLLQEMHAWLSQLVGRVSAKSELAKAIDTTSRGHARHPGSWSSWVRLSRWRPPLCPA